jgi:hypothetical protein
MYESMVFYKSFYDAIRGLDAELQAEVYNAVFAYGLYGESVELSQIANTIFTLIKPQIDANNKRRENGKKGAEYGKLGGRPKKDNGNETANKPLKNPEQTPNVNVNVNDNDNDNDNGNVKVNEKKHIYGEYRHVKLSDAERDRLFNDYGEGDTLAAIKYLDEYKERKGYKSKNDNLTLRKWVFDAIHKNDKQSQGAIDWSKV